MANLVTSFERNISTVLQINEKCGTQFASHVWQCSPFTSRERKQSSLSSVHFERFRSNDWKCKQQQIEFHVKIWPKSFSIFFRGTKTYSLQTLCPLNENVQLLLRVNESNHFYSSTSDDFRPNSWKYNKKNVKLTRKLRLNGIVLRTFCSDLTKTYKFPLCGKFSNYFRFYRLVIFFFNISLFSKFLVLHFPLNSRKHHSPQTQSIKKLSTNSSSRQILGVHLQAYIEKLSTSNRQILGVHLLASWNFRSSLSWLSTPSGIPHAGGDPCGVR